MPGPIQVFCDGSELAFSRVCLAREATERHQWASSVNLRHRLIDAICSVNKSDVSGFHESCPQESNASAPSV